MSASLWTRTVRAIPRLSPEEWRRLGVFSKWLVASRAAVLIMTLISSSIGGILAFRDGGADAGLFFLTVLGLVLAHATNNLINDFTDHLTGADKGDSFLAVDTVQAGPGDLVLVNAEGNGTRQILKSGPQTPIRSLIVGIVDTVDA